MLFFIFKKANYRKRFEELRKKYLSKLNEDQKNIKDVNIGLYLVDNKVLFEAIEKVDNNNLKEEYYLTDIVKIISKDYKAETCFIEKEKALGNRNLWYWRKIWIS